jgi:hypothetical protein
MPILPLPEQPCCPRVTLTASLGSESEKIRNLLESPLSSLAAGILARFSMPDGLLPIVTWLQRKEELLIGYRKAICRPSMMFKLH